MSSCVLGDPFAMDQEGHSTPVTVSLDFGEQGEDGYMAIRRPGGVRLSVVVGLEVVRGRLTVGIQLADDCPPVYVDVIDLIAYGKPAEIDCSSAHWSRLMSELVAAAINARIA